MSPQESFNFLNEYLSRVSPIVRRNRGLIDKFLGDGIMALFPDSVEDAIQASIEIMHEVVKYNKERQRSGLEPIRVGIALHKGSLMLGIIGEEERLQVTVISDAVNLAARMEGLTRDFGAGIVISHATLLEVGRPDAYHTRFLGNVQVKGKQEVVPVYEIYDGDAGQVIARKQETRQDFEAGLRAYLQKDFSNACMYFNAVLEVIPDDKAAQLYRQRSTRFLLSGAPAEWAGYETL
jgi:two-component system sensor histidine kinase ChiS